MMRKDIFSNDVKVIVNGIAYPADCFEVTQDSPFECCQGKVEFTFSPLSFHTYTDFNKYPNANRPTISIKKVVFNPPATIVLWNDGTKTVVKTQDDEAFDPEKGLAMAIAKKSLGNKGNYFNLIKKWIEEFEDPTNEIDEFLSKRFCVSLTDIPGVILVDARKTLGDATVNEKFAMDALKEKLIRDGYVGGDTNDVMQDAGDA